jgi:hypothetical protein
MSSQNSGQELQFFAHEDDRKLCFPIRIAWAMAGDSLFGRGLREIRLFLVIFFLVTYRS